MRYLFRFITLSMVVLGLSHSFAQTQKRYKKRNHKLQLNVALDLLEDGNLLSEKSIIRFDYARNFGRFEVGALLGLSPSEELGSGDLLNIPRLGLHAGVLAEVNFIENKRRVNWVPAFGIKVIYYQAVNPIFHVNPYLVSKHFISTRTSINLELEYPWPIFEGGRDLIPEGFWNGLKFNVAYAYYFH